MKVTHQVVFLAFAVTALGFSTGCGLLPNNSPQPTRAATQTPFIVFVPVTTTPEPATVTPLPTITPATAATGTRTATRVAVARPTATRTKTSAPVAAGPSPTTAPLCTFPPPTPLDPNDGAERRTHEAKPGSDTFIFRWTPPPGIGGDDIAYKIQMDAKGLSGKPVNSDTVYISHNKFVSDSQKQQCGNQSCFIYDNQRVWGMKQDGENSTVTWFLSVVKFTGTINDSGYLAGTASECSGSRTVPRTINLLVPD